MAAGATGAGDVPAQRSQPSRKKQLLRYFCTRAIQRRKKHLSRRLSDQADGPNHQCLEKSLLGRNLSSSSEETTSAASCWVWIRKTSWTLQHWPKAIETVLPNQKSSSTRWIQTEGHREGTPLFPTGRICCDSAAEFQCLRHSAFLAFNRKHSAGSAAY